MSSEQEEHPMVAVPDAILASLRQTALILLEDVTKDSGTTTLTVNAPWSELLHQTLDEDVCMVEPGYPPYNASIMDGYAIRTAGYTSPKSQEWSHSVKDKVFAGDPDKDRNDVPGDLPSAYYVTTGALMPDTFDCVVPMEECKVSTDQTRIAVLPEAVVTEGTWIRKVGCDIPAGAVVLPRGHVIDSAAIGLLIQSGVSQIKIRNPVKVGVLSTGNELVHPDDINAHQQVGRIPDVNRPMLLSLLSTWGPWCIPVDLGIQRDDDVPLITRTLQSALEECDVIISSGGISKGESDVMEHVLVDQLGGQLHFGRMHMKPGKPTTLVTIPPKTAGRTRLFFAMPGNPVSAIVCTQLLVQPCLNLLYHGPDTTADTHGESVDDMVYRIVQNAWLHPEVTATLTHDVKLDDERPEYHRVTLLLTDKGTYEATSTGVQRSSRLMSMRDAQGLIMLPKGEPGGKMKAVSGEKYTVLLLHDDPIRRVQVCDSLHLNRKAPKSFQISVVRVTAPSSLSDEKSLESLSDRVCSALSGSKSGPATVISSRTYTGNSQGLLEFLKMEKDADLIVVACASFVGSFTHHLDFSSTLRHGLDKVATTLALQIRRGAASEDPTSAMFECVVGYSPHGRGCMVVFLSETGLQGGLQNARGLLKHALRHARNEAKSP